MNNNDAVICAIVKNEELYIEEFIQYHFKLGFSKIYIYDNNKTPCTMSFLTNKYPDIIIVDYPGREQQLKAYNHFIETHGNKHKWCAFIDIDEFIVLKQHQNIVALLEKHCISGALCLNWYFFGSNGHSDYEPKPVLQRFTLRANNLDRHIKCIACCSDCLRFKNPHFCKLKDKTYQHDTNGKRIYGEFNYHAPSNVAVIHHYFTKSKAEFKSKIRRGKADDFRRRSPSDFEKKDFNDVEDTAALDFFRS